MKIAVITIGRSGSSELIKLLTLKSKYKIIPKPYNHLYPYQLFKKYGRRIKVIFITRNLNQVIGSVLQREKDKGLDWIKKHYKHLNSNFADYGKILQEDTLHFEKLYDAYNKQKFFNVLFIKYECLYFNHQPTINAVSRFTNIKSSIIKKKWKENHNTTSKYDIKLSWGRTLQSKINSYDFKLSKKKNKT